MTTDLKLTYQFLIDSFWKPWSERPDFLKQWEVCHFKTELYEGEIVSEALFLINGDRLGVFDATGISFYQLTKGGKDLDICVCMFSYDSISKA